MKVLLSEPELNLFSWKPQYIWPGTKLTGIVKSSAVCLPLGRCPPDKWLEIHPPSTLRTWCSAKPVGGALPRTPPKQDRLLSQRPKWKHSRFSLVAESCLMLARWHVVRRWLLMIMRPGNIEVILESVQAEVSATAVFRKANHAWRT